ncbi:Mce-family protein Mce3C [Mycobacterium tuberculosis H37Rv] [Mycolicibacterium parafortuitum]|uniref:Mce-family protein Mce3C [Mycobacterium tuberculosis H37Rv] n=1 Tax=Mycolicibacterium parafortuitum TaxID=39692 RepID=A0A375YIR8_MYCPF|nr:Mce-family protein Mce3C [Mycobacterium tuberculosis H37Rv] [Mycolicibacterium parafortuitum]
MRTEVKSFSERNPVIIGGIGVLTLAGTVLAALQYDNLPFLGGSRSYAAYFSESGGLQAGAAVQVAGYQVGEVSSVDLDGDRVLITFDVEDDIRLGEQTEANIRTKSLLGAKVLEVTPRGGGHLSAAIPVDRTKAPYQLPDALGDLTATIEDLDTDTVSGSLATLAETFKDTPPQLRAAVDGVGRFSETLSTRDAALRNLLADANTASTVLSERAADIATLVSNSNALLAELRTQNDALAQISTNLSALAHQIRGFIDDNRAQLKPTLDKLNVVLSIVDKHKAGLQQAIKYLNQYAMSLGESVASGPFFKAYIANLLPGQFIQPFIDSAFSDLGLDPNVLLPSERTDPQTGQQATPPMPVPFPRTGQGGPPRMTVADAITGNPGDQPCGPPGAPAPGPGCYPYREPLPAPPPGGPPPGPPAQAQPTDGGPR